MTTHIAEQTAGSLRLVLCALAQKSIAIEITTHAGVQRLDLSLPQARTVLTATHVWLPSLTPRAQAGCENNTLQLARVAHAAAHLLHSQAGRSTKGLKPMGVAVVSAFEDARVDRLLCAKYPGILAWFARSTQSHRQSASGHFSSLIEELTTALVQGLTGQESFWVNKACTLFFAHEKQYGLEDYDGFRRIASIMANDLGQMRVQFNPQQYIVPLAYHDDHSYLWNFEQTGSQSELKQSIAAQPRVAPRKQSKSNESSPEPSHAAGLDSTRDHSVGSVASAAQESEATVFAAGRSIFLYPEWNQRACVLRENWCTVIEDAAYPQDYKEEAGPLTEGFHPKRLNLRLSAAERTQTQRRQWRGHELDMDALIDYRASQRQEGGTDPRVFLKPRLRASTLSLLLLMDLSASTADKVGSAETSILALQKKAALDLARAARARHDRVAIHGFSSNTRHAVSYHRFLEFDQPLSATVCARVAQARPEYSTRLGAALRHATLAAGQETAERRAVIVLTDGAPADIDVFEPDYLIADAARAVGEARAIGVQVYGLVMDAQARPYAQAVYGSRAKQILEYLEALPRYLSMLYQQLRQ